MSTSAVENQMLLCQKSWLVFCLFAWLPIAVQAQNELIVRSVTPPYANSFNINQVTGAFMTRGPTDSNNDTSYRTLALFDDKLFIGAKNTLFSVDPENLTTIDHVLIPSDSGIPCKYCDNYIRVIQPLSDGVVLECGTNGLEPYCQQRNSANLSTIGTRQSFPTTDKLVPSLPHQNFSWLLVNDTGYQIFAGVNLGITFPDTLTNPAVVRADMEISSQQTTITVSIKSKTNANNVLSGPQFVGDPIEYDGIIYFFFREFALEHINGGRAVYSRVGQICKNDKGGKVSSTYGPDDVVTFAKARLDCSIRGNFPYYYNEIQDVYQSTRDANVVFAVFATRSNEVASSAVCAYRLDEIRALFIAGSRFRAQQADGQLWTEVTSEPFTPRPATCPDTTIYSDTQYQAILKLAQLMDQTAVNKLYYDYETTGASQSNPLLVSYGERFTQIVVYEDTGLLNETDVMFIGTENGTVLKAYLSEDRADARIIEEIVLNTKDKTPVLTMLKSGSDQAVFVGTENSVFKIPFQHCVDFTTKQACCNPNCIWRSSTYQCIVGKQNLENCTGTSFPIKIVTSPKSQTRIKNVPVHVNLVAKTKAGMNIRVAGNEIQCRPNCASLPFTSAKSVSPDVEYLMLDINGSSLESMNCTCDVVIQDDSGGKKTGTFNLTADDTELVEKYCLTDLSMYDYNIAQYKQWLDNWFLEKAYECGIRDKLHPNGCL